MKLFKRKRGKKYPEMVDTIHNGFEDGVWDDDGTGQETRQYGYGPAADGMEDEYGQYGSGQNLTDGGYEQDSDRNLTDGGYEQEPGQDMADGEYEQDDGFWPEDDGSLYEDENGAGNEEEGGDGFGLPEETGVQPYEDAGPEDDKNPDMPRDGDSEWEEPDASGTAPESPDGGEQGEAGTELYGKDEDRNPEGGEDSDPAVPNRRDEARMARMRRRKRELLMIRCMMGALVLLVLLSAVFIGYRLLSGGDRKNNNKVITVQNGAGEEAGADIQNENAGAPDKAGQKKEPATEKTPETPASAVSLDIIAQADLMAVQYDYDGAISLLKSQATYETDTMLQEKVAGYETAKAACVEISPDTVSHVFVHSLIVDPERAFDGDPNQDGYNLNMVTVEEFKKVIQSMYDNGYVLVSLHDMGEIDANGKMQRKSIWLPEGKKPVIFSQDDVSYYHSYANDGFADRLIVDENGEVKNEYTDAAGNTTVGDYDMVPVLDTFIKEHPDFSYRGMKGIIVLTGYNGVLGYHTDGDYRDKLSLQLDQQQWLDAHPEFDFDADVAAATKVADAMKANGWEFASHTWGHISVSDVSLEKLQEDTQKWLDYVSPIVGGTDMIIFAFGSDIGDWTGYSSDNEKFNYLKSVGFDYFCNVDGSTLSWVQFGDTYLRTGRMNIDGYRMATNPDILSPLFNVSEVYDYDHRPPMSAWSQ